MSNVKTAFKPLYKALTAMPGTTTLKDAMPKVMHLMESTGRGADAHPPINGRDGKPSVLWCAFYNTYVALKDKTGAATFSPKRRTTTGYNSYCNEGQSNWTRINKEAKDMAERLTKEARERKMNYDAGIAHVAQADKFKDAERKKCTPPDSYRCFADRAAAEAWVAKQQ